MDKRKLLVIAFAPSANLPRTRLGRELPESLAGLGAEFGVEVLPSISQRVAVAESVLCGQTVDEYEPEGESTREFAALADALEALF